MVLSLMIICELFDQRFDPYCLHLYCYTSTKNVQVWALLPPISKKMTKIYTVPPYHLLTQHIAKCWKTVKTTANISTGSVFDGFSKSVRNICIDDGDATRSKHTLEVILVCYTSPKLQEHTVYFQIWGSFFVAIFTKWRVQFFFLLGC